jgi:hypothetical protein
MPNKKQKNNTKYMSKLGSENNQKENVAQTEDLSQYLHSVHPLPDGNLNPEDREALPESEFQAGLGSSSDRASYFDEASTSLPKEVGTKKEGTLGTADPTYQYSGLDLIEDVNPSEDDFDEEDDTRLGGV